MWQALTEERGTSGRDQIWEHPDLLPTAEDLEDPEGFARGRPELDLSDLSDLNHGDEAAEQEPTPEEPKPEEPKPDDPGGETSS
jgi:hypothetical protein